MGVTDGATPAIEGRGKTATSTSDTATALLLTTMGEKGRITRMTGDRMKKCSSYNRKAIVENAPDVMAVHT